MVKRTYFFSLALLSVASNSGCANLSKEARSAESLEFRMQYADTTATISIPERSIYLFFDNSPKATHQLASVLAKNGYVVHDKVELSDAAFKVSGTFRVYGKARQGLSGDVGDVLEEALSVDAASLGEGNLRSRRTYLPDAAMLHQLDPVYAKGVLSEEVGSIVGDATGLKGWFNETLVGDPRGICFKKGCNEYVSEVTIRVEDLNGGRAWAVVGERRNANDIMLEAVIERTIEFALKPFLGKSAAN